MEVVVAVTGASGSVIAKRLLEVLKEKSVATHVVVSSAAKKVAELEKVSFEGLGTHTYDEKDFTAPIASGSHKTDGMVVVPCSMKTLGGIASGYSENLILRAADVCLKEGRKLVIVPRETPLSYIHLKNMLTLKQAGSVILPPMLSFYNEPKTIDDMINSVVGRILDQLGIENEVFKRWSGKS